MWHDNITMLGRMSHPNGYKQVKGQEKCKRLAGEGKHLISDYGSKKVSVLKIRVVR